MSGGGGGNGGGPPGGGDPGMTYTAPAPVARSAPDPYRGGEVIVHTPPKTEYITKKEPAAVMTVAGPMEYLQPTDQPMDHAAAVAAMTQPEAYDIPEPVTTPHTIQDEIDRINTLDETTSFDKYTLEHLNAVQEQREKLPPGTKTLETIMPTMWAENTGDHPVYGKNAADKYYTHMASKAFKGWWEPSTESGMNLINEKKLEIIESQGATETLAAIYDREVAKGTREESDFITSDINKAKEIANIPQNITLEGAEPEVTTDEPVTATTPTNENLLRGDVDIFTGTSEVKETINPFEETSTAGQLEKTYGQKADEEWEGKKIVDTPGGEIIINTETGDVLGTATSGPMQDEMWSPAENVSSADMAEKSTKEYDKTDANSEFYKDVDPKLAEAAAQNEYNNQIEDLYDPPDKEHFNDTQKEINTKIKEAKKDDRYDVSLTPEQSEQFQKDLNEYYGTEGVKYEEYGRAGKGTVNLSFEEHWDNAPILHPALKFSPSARFLYVIGKQAQEALTSDYGTGSYAGPGTDQGGLLGGLGKGGTLTPKGGIDVSGGEGSQSSPEATAFITTGHTPPSNSVAGNWYQSLGGTKAFNLATEYAAAKAAVQNRLGTPSTYGWLAVNNSPFYNWLQTNSLDKGIL
jgi:hypothetical protein